MGCKVTDLMRKFKIGMRIAERDLPALQPPLGFSRSALGQSYIRLKCIEVEKNAARYITVVYVFKKKKKKSSCFSFTLNAIQEPVTHLSATVVGYRSIHESYQRG